MKMAKGFGMIEIIVASAIVGVVMISIIGVYNSMATISLRNTDTVQATFLIEEGAEAVRILRDTSWSSRISTLTPGTTYRLFWTGTTFVATTSFTDIDNFDRTFVVSTVNRDGNFNIAQSGGSADANSRKVTMSVAWLQGVATTTKSLEFYIFNTFNN